MNSNTYRTSDMGLATYLTMSGHSYQDVEWDNGTCYWVFYPTKSLEDEVDKFISGNAKVEPREFNRAFSRIKASFHKNNRKR